MASGLQGGCGGSEQHSKKANHQAERISATGAQTAGFRADEKTTGTGVFANHNRLGRRTHGRLALLVRKLRTNNHTPIRVSVLASKIRQNANPTPTMFHQLRDAEAKQTQPPVRFTARELILWLAIYFPRIHCLDGLTFAITRRTTASEAPLLDGRVHCRVRRHSSSRYLRGAVRHHHAQPNRVRTNTG